MATLIVVYPHGFNADEVIEALRKRTEKIHLRCHFNDKSFIESTEMQVAISQSSMLSGRIKSLTIINNCNDPEVYATCLNFFIRCLKGPNNKIDEFAWSKQDHPINKHDQTFTSEDAKRIALAIMSSNNIKKLSITNTFKRAGTFKCIFNAVLDIGIPSYTIGFIGRGTTSALSMNLKGLLNNTSLKTLELSGEFDLNRVVQFDAKKLAKYLAKILRSNKGLEDVIISTNLMDNTGRKILLKRLRNHNNSTLLKLSVTNYDKVLIKSTRGIAYILQSEIDFELKCNRIMKRYDMNLLAAQRKKSISLKIYPGIIDAIQQKEPNHMYRFLQNENEKLCSYHACDERRSV
ncbi:hypothetical protein FRACYDRAFT_249374 [Fragilariopsis cylindrus CCMP1102]|uniref:Uncharacterized protein n=1 Tax=Fragilariopsis cylindrus CCMP1102 TaxID=635003 RepID=A0A1E7ET44_9STRA|nr:hypothetical protein FRACYDRAFT_249374 [Fragilariopsis cylindrus CCMP1102]|eukprot:OEU09029.1 hypothetical protein FRACYDRAFT_249374 [Fragilariopsis cylindrus CCMP1102]